MLKSPHDHDKGTDDKVIVPSDEMNQADGSTRNDSTNIPTNTGAPADYNSTASAAAAANANADNAAAAHQLEEIHDDDAPLRPSDVAINDAAFAKVAKYYEQDEKKPCAKQSNKEVCKKDGKSIHQRSRGLELADDADTDSPLPTPQIASLLETIKVPVFGNGHTNLANSIRRPVGLEEIQDDTTDMPLPPGAVAAGLMEDADAVMEKIRNNNEAKMNEDEEGMIEQQLEIIGDDGDGPPTPMMDGYDDSEIKQQSSLLTFIKKKKKPSAAVPSSNTLNGSLIVDTNMSPSLHNGESHELCAQVSYPNPDDGFLRADATNAQQAFEGYLVEEQKRETVYEPEIVDSDDESNSGFEQTQTNFQRRNRIMIATVGILVAGIIAAVAGALLARTSEDNDGNATPSSNLRLTPSPTMMPTLPPPPLNCTVQYNGPMYENDCKPYACNHIVERDGSLIAMYRSRMSEIQYLTGRSLEMVANQSYDQEADDMIFKPGLFFVSSPYSRDGYGVVKISPRDASGSISLNETVTLSPIDERVGFGTSIDVDWNVLAVGVPEDNDNAGSVFIYRENEDLAWVEEARLSPTDPSAQRFGNSVLVKDNLLVVAARGGGVGEVGKVFFYEYKSSSSAWIPLDDYTLVNEECDGDFGASLAFTINEGLLVGCPLENVYQRSTGKEASSAGAVYYYQRVDDGNGQYKLMQNITVTNGKRLEKFSGNHHHIATNAKGDVALLGTYGRLGGNDEKVFVFRNFDNDWRQVAELLVQDTMWFGEDLVIHGDQILVGSWENVYSYSMSCDEWDET